MENVTRRVEDHVPTPDGHDVIETLESEAKHSVEIGETAKGEVYVKSVKVYAMNEIDAAERAIVTLRYLQQQIRGE